MSKPANPLHVGIFVMAGLSLALATLLVLGSLRWFTSKAVFVCYFEDSVTGLEVGAPVKMKGVRIGQVKEVMIRFNQASNDVSSPVLLELDPRILAAKSDRSVDLRERAHIEAEIQRGLRAELELESFVTGRLNVDLGFFRDASAPTFHQVQPLYPEIPTRPTQLSQVLRNLSQVDLKNVAERLGSVLTKLDRGLDEVQFREINQSVLSALRRIDDLLGSPELKATLASVRQAADDIGQLAGKVEGKVDPLAGKLEDALDEVSRTLAGMREAALSLRNTLAEESPLRAELESTLSSLAEAARSVSALADFARRNPQSFLTGRKPPPQPRAR